jgi:hypothetical protein
MVLIFYYILRLFASTEACPFCYYVKFVAAGVILFFMSVGAVGEDRLTAVMNVVLPANAKTTARPKGDIAKRLEGKKPTAKPKTVVGMV